MTLNQAASLKAGDKVKGAVVADVVKVWVGYPSKDSDGNTVPTAKVTLALPGGKQMILSTTAHAAHFAALEVL